jgi:hypothetical protein
MLPFWYQHVTASREIRCEEGRGSGRRRAREKGEGGKSGARRRVIDVWIS